MNPYVRLTDQQLEQVLPLIVHEFKASPVLTYLIPNEQQREVYLHPLFKTILTTYEEIGDTYATPTFDFTFSLVKGELNHSFYSLIHDVLKTVPQIVKDTLTLDTVELTKKIFNMRSILLDARHYFNEQKVPYFFLSSIGILNQENRLERMTELLNWLKEYVQQTKTVCLVETETIESISLYQEFGFQLDKQYLVSHPKTCIYLLSFRPK